MATNSIALFAESTQLISETALEGVFFGINFSLYFLCVQLFYHQYLKASFDERRKIIFLFIYNSLMVLWAVLILGMGGRAMQLAYIYHGGVHGEPVEFVTGISSASTINLVIAVTGLLINILNSFMQLRRIWVIWATSPYKLVVTAFAFLLAVASLSLDIYAQTLPGTTSAQVFSLWGTAILASGFAFIVLVMILLVGRIIVARIHQNRLMGTSSENTNQYTSIVAMLVESYALDAIWSLAALISFALGSEGHDPFSLSQIFNNAGDQVTVITFLFVTYRVLLGRAWTPETGRQLSTMRWNHSSEEDTTNEMGSIEYTVKNSSVA